MAATYEQTVVYKVTNFIGSVEFEIYWIGQTSTRTKKKKTLLYDRQSATLTNINNDEIICVQKDSK